MEVRYDSTKPNATPRGAHSPIVPIGPLVRQPQRLPGEWRAPRILQCTAKVRGKNMGDEWIRGNDRIERVLADPEQRIRVEEIVALMRVEDEAEAGSE